MKNTYIIFILLLSLVGCSNKVGVHGKVSYPDGKPLATGSVIFQNEKMMAEGHIKPDGTYRLGMLKEGDGIEPGSYQVFISGAVDVVPAPPREKASDPMLDPKITYLIDKKMTQPETSGLTCVVEKGMKLPYNIMVEKLK
jgi:hypothetical protein